MLWVFTGIENGYVHHTFLFCGEIKNFWLESLIWSYGIVYIIFSLCFLFVLRFYGPVNPMGHVERGQFT